MEFIIFLLAKDVGIFTKVKREALEKASVAAKPDAPKVVAIKKGKRKGKVNE